MTYGLLRNVVSAAVCFLLVSCTSTAKQSGPSPTLTVFPPVSSDTANAAALPTVVTVVVENMSQRVRQEMASVQDGPPLRFGVWSIQVEEFVVSPRPDASILLYVQESYVTEDGRSVVPRFPYAVESGERAVFFLSHQCPGNVARSGSAFCLDGQVPGMTGPRIIRDGFVEVVRQGQRVEEPVGDFLTRVTSVAKEFGKPTP